MHFRSPPMMDIGFPSSGNAWRDVVVPQIWYPSNSDMTHFCFFYNKHNNVTIIIVNQILHLFHLGENDQRCMNLSLIWGYPCLLSFMFFFGFGHWITLSHSLAITEYWHRVGDTEKSLVLVPYFQYLNNRSAQAWASSIVTAENLGSS